jgi:uncharacterized membrane protein
MDMLPKLLSALSILLTAAIFGFFYAWVCSTMWGLDQTDPRTALDAMKSMNASVRNALFFPAFFLTPLALGLAAWAWVAAGQQTAAAFFGAAALVYLLGGLVLTMAVNVPMNEALAAKPTPQDIEAARVLWSQFSAPWQVWNITRAVASGFALLLATLGLMAFTSSANT